MTRCDNLWQRVTSLYEIRDKAWQELCPSPSLIIVAKYIAAMRGGAQNNTLLPICKWQAVTSCDNVWQAYREYVTRRDKNCAPPLLLSLRLNIYQQWGEGRKFILYFLYVSDKMWQPVTTCDKPIWNTWQGVTRIVHPSPSFVNVSKYIALMWGRGTMLVTPSHVFRIGLSHVVTGCHTLSLTYRQ